jgi:16S rRNA (cytosine1402-N4)-methyltransferase
MGGIADTPVLIPRRQNYAAYNIMAESSSVHVPVLLEQVVHWLEPCPGAVLVDGTLGGGGHTRALAAQVGKDGLVIAIDRDPAAIDAAERSLRGLPVRLARANFCDLPEVLEQLKIKTVDGVVFDLGLSSDQLADTGRGFSFSADGPLDLRFDPTSGEPARRLVNRLSEEHLTQMFSNYGEERYSRRIAKAIVRQRREQPIETSAELAELIRRSVPRPPGRERIDPATRTFQALRIAVNDELVSLEIALRRIPNCLRLGGRMAVISFHSLEDRRVKESFRSDQRLKVLTRRPVRPEEAEMQDNPRSRSAKLRVAERVE